jgi:hypothetical protein
VELASGIRIEPVPLLVEPVPLLAASSLRRSFRDESSYDSSNCSERRVMPFSTGSSSANI